MAKVGLGQLFTFDFISPCFEKDAPRKKPWETTNKYDSMSFYGEVKFDFAQFGKNDEILKKQYPVQYCLKVCHMIGYYLQMLYQFDLMRMKIDFNQDEFGEIWLTQVEKIIVRKRRDVPKVKGTGIADYVLQHMEEVKKIDEKKEQD